MFLLDDAIFVILGILFIGTQVVLPLLLDLPLWWLFSAEKRIQVNFAVRRAFSDASKSNKNNHKDQQ